MSENEVEAAVLRFVQAKGFRPVRNHTGLFRRLNSEAKIKIGTEGMSDWTFIRGRKDLGNGISEVLHWEAKRRGAKPSQKQFEVMASLNHLGELAVWSDSLERFKEIYFQYFRD